VIGRRYFLPHEVKAALEQVFAEPVDGIVVIEKSLYARAHLGMRATTRPNRVLLACSGAQFVADPELLLHEYFHVVRQWRTGHLTRWRYPSSSLCGAAIGPIVMNASRATSLPRPLNPTFDA